MRDAIEQYFNEVSRLPLPSAEEELSNFSRYGELLRQRKVAATSRERASLDKEMREMNRVIAQGYLRYVIGEARKRTRDAELLPDLISAGNEGLLCAIPKFDPRRGHKFLTFAFYWVRVKMNTVLAKRSEVHVSVHHKRKEAKEGVSSSTPTFVAFDDIEIASDATAEPAPPGRALRYLNAAELPMRERIAVIYRLGLRGPPKEHTEIALIMYTLERSLVTAHEVEAFFDAGMRRLRDWVALCGEASVREDLAD